MRHRSGTFLAPGLLTSAGIAAGRATSTILTVIEDHHQRAEGLRRSLGTDHRGFVGNWGRIRAAVGCAGDAPGAVGASRTAAGATGSRVASGARNQDRD